MSNMRPPGFPAAQPTLQSWTRLVKRAGIRYTRDRGRKLANHKM